jgi:hypothetical protein
MSNFITGLTNVFPIFRAPDPVLWQYIVCGQHRGAVPEGATVSLTCADNMMPYRYLIVEVVNECFNAIEVEVLLWGKNNFICLCL